MIIFLLRILTRTQNKKVVVAIHDVNSTVHFENKILFLKKYFSIVSPDEFFDDSIVTEKIKILITFDDGYQDWFTNVMPVLEKHKAYALFFTSSGIFSQKSLPSTDFIVDNFNRKTLGLKPLTKNDAIRMAKSKYIFFGGHTTNHVDMSKLTDVDFIHEIYNDKKYLEELIDDQIFYFAYPYGREINFNKDSFKILRDACYSHAFTITPHETYDPYEYYYPRCSLDIDLSNYYWYFVLMGGTNFKSFKNT